MSFRTIFITLSIIAAVALVGGGIFLLTQLRGASGLDISLKVPRQISVGMPFDLEIDISNDSQNILKDAELAIELPEGIVFLGSSPEKTIATKSLGNLGPGSLSQETFELLSLSGESTIKKIKATVTYSPESLGAKFEESRDIDFSVVGSSIDMDLSMPQKVFSSEEFEMTIDYEDNSDVDFKDLRLKVTYPPSFTFKSSSLEPEFGNNLWELGDLRSGSKGSITIKGNLIGPDDAFFEFRSVMEADFLGRAYTVQEKSASVAISPSPLSLTINLNDKPDYTAHLNDDLTYKLNFSNNTEVALKDIILRAKLVGQMFDLTTLSTNAALRSVDNTLIWNTSNTPELAVLPVGQNGTVEFRIKTKTDYPIRQLSDKNFSLKVEAEIESPTVPPFVASNRTIGIAKTENKVSGEIKVETQGFFRDAPSGILNKGPWPPKVGAATQFTIHWLIRNSSTDVREVEVKAFLGPNVRLTGVIESNAASKPTYNDRTQEVIWELDFIPATKGILNAPLEAIFQVELTPAVTQVNTSAVLLRETAVKANDEFTGATLVNTDGEVTTTNLDDPTVAATDGTVKQ